MRFQNDQVCVKRYDSHKADWLSMGSGQISISYNPETGLAKLIFIKVNENRVKLLQYIDGEHRAQLIKNENDVQTEVTWTATDYASSSDMGGVNGKWKLKFNDKYSESSTIQFLNMFNMYIKQQISKRRNKK